MSYTSKKNIAGILAGITLIAAYIIYAMGTSAPDPEDIQGWATAILVFIGIGIGVQIAVQIVFHIAFSIGVAMKEGRKAGNKEGGKAAERIIKSEMVEDEWSRMISLKASRAGSMILGAGTCAALVVLAAGAKTVVALHLLFGLSAFAAVAEGIAGIIMNERGIKK